jgi:hypothetical protein
VWICVYAGNSLQPVRRRPNFVQLLIEKYYLINISGFKKRIAAENKKSKGKRKYPCEQHGV